MENGQSTYQEIMSQPETWSAALDVFNSQQDVVATFFADAKPDFVIFSGCGSAHYLAMVGARVFQQVNHIPAVAYPASELVLYPESIFLPGKMYLLVTVSRSGTTSETVSAVNSFKEHTQGNVVVVTCDRESPLAKLGDLTIAIDAAQEESVAQTRSFSSMAVVLQQMAACVAGESRESSQQLATVCRDLLGKYESLAEQLGQDETIQKFFFLGTNPLYGIASEAMLKMTEMSISYSEVYHTLEFRHGPMAMVDASSLVVGLVSPGSAHEIAVLSDMQANGATVLALTSTETAFEHEIRLPDDIPSWNMPILYLPVLQLMAYYRALFNGKNPDAPENLLAFIVLDDL